jgi:hypothetical protein
MDEQDRQDKSSRMVYATPINENEPTLLCQLQDRFSREVAK